MVVVADKGWTPSRYGVSSSSQVVDGELSGISIRHHMFPFRGELEVSGQPFDELSLQKLALNYLSEVERRGYVNLPRQWLDALKAGADDSNFGWMPVRWPLEPEHEDGDNAGDPFVSFRVERKATHGEPERTVMLLAAERLAGKFTGSGFGINVVANLRSPEQGKIEAQIVGLSASFPYAHHRNGLSNTAWAASNEQTELLKASFAGEVRREIESVLGLSSVTVRRVRCFRTEGSDEWQVERYCTGKKRSAIGHVTAFSFRMVGTAASAGRLVSKVPMHADAVDDAGVFEVDPASQGTNVGYRSRRPSRTDEELDRYRTTVQLPSSPTPLQLADSRGHDLMRVIACPNFVLADKAIGSGNPKTVDLQDGDPPIHSDDFSAVSAFYNAKKIFDRMIAYGLDPFDYFRFASLPLMVAYRSGMQVGPGKDGRTINACVQVDGWAFDFIGPTAIGDRPTIEMRLALADLSRRGRKRWDQVNRSVAEPLGIAADDRWMWHEAGHVLLVAAVGELEFRFAHSAGDALAAVALDPVSKLRVNPEVSSYWRGMTFPWVFVPRRHDRCVTDGWSWGGAMHSALASVPDSTPPRRKGYLSEQILSTSLFRLYRILGGDTFEDDSAREAASHYCIFLIMDAIRRMGTEPAVSLHNNPEQFVYGLLDADTATLEWKITFPSTGGKTYMRVGGCAYKAIRWAFEAQGLYAPADVITNAPGLPPKVDVYIADGRKSEMTENGIIKYGRGNYAPVSLLWDTDQSGNEPPPAWQADRNAIRVRADGIHVVVGNRGTEDAGNVEVSVFWIAWPANSRPTWNSAGWRQCPPIAVQDIPAGADNVHFGPFRFTPPAAGRYIVVAKATCADDPANPDAANFACSYMETPLVDLIAGDNNLGLRTVTIA